VGEVVRNFTLTLWNVYSFFVTYANLDRWEPTLTSGPSPFQGEESIPLTSSPSRREEDGGHPLDRWLLSELNGLVKEVTQALDNYDVTGATRPIQGFVDDLSKWYLRRSRRRFWKSELDSDKASAYATLYQTLVTLSKLLAPSMPFLSEALYQNLVRSFDSSATESVHLSNWPTYDPDFLDEMLNQDMHLVMQLASLGHAARSQAGIKVRQPLAEIAFALGKKEERLALEKYADLLADELNVKQARALSSADEAVSYTLKPLPKQLGQRYKALFPKVSQAILETDAVQAAHAILAGEPFIVAVDGAELNILPEEVEVRAEARSGLAVATEGSYLAALQTELTPELIQEGLAREFVRRVQELRKQADFEIADRIQLFLSATPDLVEAVRAHREYIFGETLTLNYHLSDPPTGSASTEAWFDGQWMKIGITKVPPESKKLKE
jgi:isoleucyl-tRNA synthetase